MTKDNIGREEIVDKMFSLINSLSGEHFCLSLNGEWGSGKSFVLDMLSEKLMSDSSNIIVKYDAWENSFYKDPLIAILANVIDCISEYAKSIDEYKTVLKDYAKKKGKELIDNLSMLNGKVGFFARIVKELIEIVPKFLNVSPLGDTSEQVMQDFKSYKTLISKAKEILNRLSCNEFEKYRVIILVDEIDRCLPNEQLIILERLHHLFDINNCAVIIALNKKQIIDTYNKNFSLSANKRDDSDVGKEYLRKFFDYNFDLTMSSEVFFQNYIWDKIVDNAEFKQISPISKQQIAFFQSMVFEIIKNEFDQRKGIDTRSVKRVADQIVSILRIIQNQGIDYGVLLFVGYMVSICQYERKTYESIIKKDISSVENIDIFSSLGIGKGLVYGTKTLYNNNCNSSFITYNDKGMNNANFYINKWISEGNNNIIPAEMLFMDHISVISSIIPYLQKLIMKIDSLAQ